MTLESKIGISRSQFGTFFIGKIELGLVFCFPVVFLSGFQNHQAKKASAKSVIACKRELPKLLGF